MVAYNPNSKYEISMKEICSLVFKLLKAKTYFQIQIIKLTSKLKIPVEAI